MKKIIILLGFLIWFPIKIQASEWYSITYTDNIEKECNMEYLVFGCYYHDTNNIFIYKKAGHKLGTEMLLHEQGHFYTRNEDTEKLQEMTKDIDFYNELKPREKAAQLFVDWSITEQMNIIITKKYYKYRMYNEVYRYD